MGTRLSEHFDLSEFVCPCCRQANPDGRLVERLEKLHDLMGARAIIITSGYRCPDHSVAVGGYRNDAHTCNIAADIKVKKPDGSWYSSLDIAEAAERVGFSGIGTIDDTACHVDIRDKYNYVNSHWFGSEQSGNDSISTFQRGTVFPSRTPVQVETPVTEKKTIQLVINGEVVWENEI